MNTLSANFVLESRKTLKNHIINILKKFNTHIRLHGKFKSRKKMKKHVIIKTIRTGIDMGVSPRLGHKI